jgi:hypothetical protein
MLALILVCALHGPCTPEKAAMVIGGAPAERAAMCREYPRRTLGRLRGGERVRLHCDRPLAGDWTGVDP